MSHPPPPLTKSSHGASKKMKGGLLITNPKFFATSKSAHRAYKFFSSISVYHSSYQARDFRFEGLFDKIKYVKKLKIPMIIGIPNSNQVIKRVKAFNKTMTHSTNLLSYLLSKGKHTSILAQYHKRAFKASRYIVEGFLPKFCPLDTLKYQPKLTTLKIWGTSFNLPNLQTEFNSLIHYLKKLKHLSVYGIDFDKILKNPEILPNLKCLYANGLMLEKYNFEKLAIQEFGYLNLQACPSMTSFLKEFAKVKNLIRLTISSKIPITQSSSVKEEIYEFISKVGLTVTAHDQATSNQHISIRTPQYEIEANPLKFSFIRK